MSDLRCPRCGAVLRPGDQWCGLCFADFRAPPPVVADVNPPAEAAPAAGGELAPPLIRPPVPGAVPPQPAAAPPPAAPPPPAQVAPPAAAAPAPVIPTQPATPLATTVTPTPFVPSTNPLAAAPAVPAQLPAGVEPVAAPAGETGAEAEATPTWPCPRCGATVPMTDDYCEACGHGFLDDVRGKTSVKVPLFGDVGSMNSGQKLMMGVSVAVGILLVILALLAIGGSIFG